MTTPPADTTIAIVHANAATMAPVKAAFSQVYPQAALWHLLDDRLVTDAEAAGGLTTSLHLRMETLIGYAVEGGADAVQLACSMYGPVAKAVSHGIPILASDQAMFDEVVRLRPGKVAILASLRPAADDSVERLKAELRQAGLNPDVQAVVVDEAKAASAAGDLDLLGKLLAEAASQLDAPDVVVLAQYSLAPVRDAVAAAVGAPVLSGPHLAASALAGLLHEETK